VELDTLLGLPAHALIVHAVVVLVPLAALGAIAVVLSPSLRARYGSLVGALSAVAVVLVPLASGSGEQLEQRVTETALVERHTAMGEQLLPFVAVMAVATLAVLVVDRVRAARPQTAPRWAAPWVATLAVVIAVATAAGSLVQVARIGHSGAKAVWHTTASTR